MIQNEAFVPFELQLVGVLSRKDLKKGGSVVRDVMTSPPIALGATDKAFVAGHTMLDVSRRSSHSIAGPLGGSGCAG
jgi:hypothetical protein